MKARGVSDKGLSRIAKSLRKTSQQEKLFDKPEYQERPMEDIERDQRRSEGIFPMPLSVENFVYSGSGYLNPPTKLDEFDGYDMDKLFEQESLTPQEVAAYVLEHYEVDILEGISPEDVAALDYRDIIELMEGHKIRPGGNTTYNWGWWGPDMSFYEIGPSDIQGEPYAEGVLLIGYGTSAYPQRAYKLESVAEEAPWYDLHMDVQINTDEGVIQLGVEDNEGYHFYVSKDETGTWEEGDSIKWYDDVEDKLNWGDSDLHDIW